jgi:uncharacterized protein YyaL (SSP411 family)
LYADGEKIEETIKTYLSPSQSNSLAEFDLEGHPIAKGLSFYIKRFDHEYGGFSNAPKFPSPVVLNFLTAQVDSKKNKENEFSRQESAMNMARITLLAMARGGIYDQLGGGFHRYSTDRVWHVPHFEKMLYDNAQLIIAYTDMYKITGEDYFREIAEATADYVLRDLCHFEGGFYSGEDADSPEMFSGDPSVKKEGAFYVWEVDEVRNMLDRQGFDITAYYFGIKPDGNAINDPHGEFKGKNILFKAHSIKETADEFGMDMGLIKNIIEDSKAKLFSERNKRIRPHLDDKILTAWNGLMISALARAYKATGKETYREAAVNSVFFIMIFNTPSACGGVKGGVILPPLWN